MKGKNYFELRGTIHFVGPLEEDENGKKSTYIGIYAGEDIKEHKKDNSQYFNISMQGEAAEKAFYDLQPAMLVSIEGELYHELIDRPNGLKDSVVGLIGTKADILNDPLN